MTLLDHGRLQRYGLPDGSTGLSQVEKVDQTVVRPAHKVVRALFVVCGWRENPGGKQMFIPCLLKRTRKPVKLDARCYINLW